MAASRLSSARRSELEEKVFSDLYDVRIGRDVSSNELLSLTTEWFNSPTNSIGLLGRDDVARVLRDLTKPGGIGFWEAISDANVPMQLRIDAVEACVSLFAQL